MNFFKEHRCIKKSITKKWCNVYRKADGKFRMNFKSLKCSDFY